MGVLSATLVAAIVGWYYKKGKPKVEDFDALIGKLGDPILIEEELTKLLPDAAKLQDNSIYLQILSQIALFQAVQQKFEQAHKTLDEAQSQLKPKDYVAAVRILCERGRVFQQAGDLEQALCYFQESYQISVEHYLDFHTINAAHMIAIVVPELQEKIAWNEKALHLALTTKDKKAASWLAPLYNNLGQNYFDLHHYEKSLECYQKSFDLFASDEKFSNLRFARWTIARCLRKIGRIDEAVILQQQLLNEYLVIEKSGTYDTPAAMFILMRGLVYEELAELYMAQNNLEQAQKYAQSAVQDLAHDEMFLKTSPDRIERLNSIIHKN